MACLKALDSTIEIASKCLKPIYLRLVGGCAVVLEHMRLLQSVTKLRGKPWIRKALYNNNSALRYASSKLLIWIKCQIVSESKFLPQAKLSPNRFSKEKVPTEKPNNTRETALRGLTVLILPIGKYSSTDGGNNRLVYNKKNGKNGGCELVYVLTPCEAGP